MTERRVSAGPFDDQVRATYPKTNQRRVELSHPASLRLWVTVTLAKRLGAVTAAADLLRRLAARAAA
jgi:hypothetical protein